MYIYLDSSYKGEPPPFPRACRSVAELETCINISIHNHNYQMFVLVLKKALLLLILTQKKVKKASCYLKLNLRHQENRTK